MYLLFKLIYQYFYLIYLCLKLIYLFEINLSMFEINIYSRSRVTKDVLVVSNEPKVHAILFRNKVIIISLINIIIILLLSVLLL